MQPIPHSICFISFHFLRCRFLICSASPISFRPTCVAEARSSLQRRVTVAHAANFTLRFSYFKLGLLRFLSCIWLGVISPFPPSLQLVRDKQSIGCKIRRSAHHTRVCIKQGSGSDRGRRQIHSSFQQQGFFSRIFSRCFLPLDTDLIQNLVVGLTNLPNFNFY